jgi:hypothetical protein
MKENYIENQKPIRLNDILVRMVKFWGARALLKKRKQGQVKNL